MQGLKFGIDAKQLSLHTRPQVLISGAYFCMLPETNKYYISKNKTKNISMIPVHWNTCYIEMKESACNQPLPHSFNRIIAL